MKPSKDLIEQWANQAHEEVTNADVSRAGGSTRIAVNIRIAELAAKWGAEQAIKNHVLLSALESAKAHMQDGEPHTLTMHLTRKGDALVADALAVTKGASQAQQTTEPELPDDEPSDAEWDKVDPAFTEWWNAEYDDTTNPFRIDSLAYWAWAGWKAAGVRAGMGQQWQPIDSATKDEIVLVAGEFDCPGDWRIKVGYQDAENGHWKVWGASWKPSHWMPLPAPPAMQGGQQYATGGAS